MKIKKWLALGSVSMLPLTSIAIVSCGDDHDHDHDHEGIEFTDALLNKFPQAVVLPAGTTNTDIAALKAALKKAIETAGNADTNLTGKDKEDFNHLMEHDYDESAEINTANKTVTIDAHGNNYVVSYTIAAASSTSTS